MIGIIEAGGSKTELRFGDLESQKSVQGIGINPYFQDDSEIHSRLKEIFEQTSLEVKKIRNIIYYGAGCSSQDQKNRVQNVLRELLPGIDISVESDLLGAARALCEDEMGFVGILGTGSNACIYNGTTIEKEMISLGFWLGDEGSGGYLGKLLFKEWLKGNLPHHFEQEFEQTYGCIKKEALQKLYSDPNPNRNIAKLASIAIQNKQNTFFKILIIRSLESYFKEIKPLYSNYKDITFHFNGSIAWFLKEEIQSIIGSLGYKTGRISDNPSAELFKYHLNKLRR